MPTALRTAAVGSRLRPRMGFTLAEVLIALVMTGVIGAAITSVFVTQSSFYDRQEKESFARGVTRGATNVLTSDLRMVERDSGVVQASSSRLVLRVPYIMGVSCGGSGGTTMVVRHLRTDPILLADTVYSGYARMRADGSYRYHDLPSGSSHRPTLNDGNATCVAAGIDSIRGGGGTLTIPTPASADIAPAGHPVLLYQLVTYEFKTVAGQLGLWRTVHRKGGSGELMVAPFAPTAGFRFYVNDEPLSQAEPPAVLRELTGIEIRMDAMSQRPDRDGTHRTVPLATSVFFKNRR
jgi:hypothetical protein